MENLPIQKYYVYSIFGQDFGLQSDIVARFTCYLSDVTSVTWLRLWMVLLHC